MKEEGEKKNLRELIEYCNLQNKWERIPHFLIVNYPDFEYISCLHMLDYKGQDVKQYIEKEMGYKSVDDFKADKKVYDVLNSHGNSKAFMLEALKKGVRFAINKYSMNKKQYDIKNEIICAWDKLGYKGSNIDDFFSVLNQF